MAFIVSITFGNSDRICFSGVMSSTMNHCCKDRNSNICATSRETQKCLGCLNVMSRIFILEAKMSECLPLQKHLVSTKTKSKSNYSGCGCSCVLTCIWLSDVVEQLFLPK